MRLPALFFGRRSLARAILGETGAPARAAAVGASASLGRVLTEGGLTIGSATDGAEGLDAVILVDAPIAEWPGRLRHGGRLVLVTHRARGTAPDGAAAQLLAAGLVDIHQLEPRAAVFVTSGARPPF